jgi:hypothetical protein
MRLKFRQFSKILLLGVLTLNLNINQAKSCSVDGKEGILPKNDLNIPTSIKSANQMTRVEFYQIIKNVQKLYEGEILERFGATLKIKGDWEDGTVNAYAMQSGTTYHVKMFGGIARHPAMSKNALRVVLCHELGHHIGGAPNTTRLFGFVKTWAANEGQSDYFATSKCMRKLLLSEEPQERVEAPETVTRMCDEIFKNEEDKTICINSSMAGQDLANLFHSFRSSSKKVSFDTPDPKKVFRTSGSHPAAQCRLDTYFQGALCEIDANEHMTFEDEQEGACVRMYGYDIGIRPTCWYKPKSW